MKGGSIRIFYRGSDCAPDRFIDALKFEFLKQPTAIPPVWVRLDREIYSVRYLANLEEELARLFDFPVGEVPSSSHCAKVQIASGNTSGAESTTNVQDVSITQNFFDGLGSDNVAVGRRLEKWLPKALSGKLDGGTVLILLNDGLHKDQTDFWRYLWRNVLIKFLDRGLIFVHMCDLNLEDGIHDLAPRDAIEFFLDPIFDESSKVNAIEDIAVFLSGNVKGMDVEAATWVAKHIVAREATVRNIHASISTEYLRKISE